MEFLAAGATYCRDGDTSDVDVVRAVPIEQWAYDPDPKQFVRYLPFQDGVIEIEEGSDGH